MPSHYLITGATGFVGSHVAEACIAHGLTVSTLARPTSDTALLERLGVAIHRGDLTDAALLRKAVEPADVIIHCAAKVGERGRVEDYRAVNVEALRQLLEACKGRPLHRFVHMSSLGVYAARHHYGTDETEPLPDDHIDGYTQTKVEAERLVMDFYQRFGIPVVVLRPGFVYGPRDRIVMPKLIKRMAADEMHYLGGDQRALNTIYVGNLVDAVFLALDNPGAVGQAYNLTDGEHVTRQRFFETISAGLNLPKPHQRLPKPVAALVVRFLRWQGRRAIHKGKEPWIPPARLKFLSLNLDFSIEKAQRELGYRPRVSFEQGLRETIAWYREKT
jgi:nucleoside-diphosphate-sugar epimerase